MATQPIPSASWALFARDVLAAAVLHADQESVPAPRDVSLPHGGVFVTLHKHRRLRGCMGTLDADVPLAEAVRRATLSAAFHDPRFPPVASPELAELDLEVSVLSHPEPMHDLAELVIGRHGVLVRRGPQRGLFLPQVAAEHHLDRETFVSRCCDEKAGLPADAWRQPDTEVLLFTTEVFRA
jgi:AmmeMemoRadiSam system protein A